MNTKSQDWIAWFFENRGNYFVNTQSVISANTRMEAIQIAENNCGEFKHLNGVSLIPCSNWNNLNIHFWK